MCGLKPKQAVRTPISLENKTSPSRVLGHATVRHLLIGHQNKEINNGPKNKLRTQISRQDINISVLQDRQSLYLNTQLQDINLVFKKQIYTYTC